MPLSGIFGDLDRFLNAGHRHRPLHDFGYVALDIVGLIEEDNGVYTCRATNNHGVDETSAILRCYSECTSSEPPRSTVRAISAISAREL